MRSKEERRAAFNAVDKLRRIGDAYVVLAVAKDKADFEKRRNASPGAGTAVRLNRPRFRR